jgi:uncharacterized protein with von Willebrand factor type A (vWA) domain
MFLGFFDSLRREGVPVSLREHLAFLEALSAGLATYELEGFYFLARTCLVKDERHLDRFDRAFSAAFKGLESVSPDQVIDKIDLPREWLEKLAERYLTEA